MKSNKEAFAEKSYVSIKSVAKICSILGISKAAEHIDIPLEFLYIKMKQNGWFETELSISQMTELKNSIEEAFKETEEMLPQNKRELLKRARIVIDDWITNNPNDLISLFNEQKLAKILKRPDIIEGEFLLLFTPLKKS